MIENHKLSDCHGPHQGILDVDLQIEQGEVSSFLGSNGKEQWFAQLLLMDESSYADG